jgi:hypothetical protein
MQLQHHRWFMKAHIYLLIKMSIWLRSCIQYGHVSIEMYITYCWRKTTQIHRNGFNLIEAIFCIYGKPVIENY